MKIGVDIMGGDFAPEAAIKGALLAFQEWGTNVTLVLFGDEAIIRHKITEYGGNPDNFQIVHAPEVVEMAASPVKSIQERPESSLVKGFDYLKEGQIDGFTSAGNTGAMLVASVIKIGVVRESLRPCLISHVPRPDGSTGILTDVGANADCKPENLVDFAILGSCYAEFILDVKRPKVGLVNIGEEPEKGNALTIATFQLLNKLETINFIGNVESRLMFAPVADVLVCSGFVGNVMIKLAESVYDLVKESGHAGSFFSRMNYEEHGGSPVLGIHKPVVVGHGISSPDAIKNMIGLSIRLAETNICEKIKEAIQYV